MKSCEFSQVIIQKAKNSLKKRIYEKYHASIIQACLSQIKKKSILFNKQCLNEIFKNHLILKKLSSNTTLYHIISVNCLPLTDRAHACSDSSSLHFFKRL